MAETRPERLARIAAKLEHPVPGSDHPDGAGTFHIVTSDDLAWLLSQVSDTLEYRVECQMSDGTWDDHVDSDRWSSAQGAKAQMGVLLHTDEQYGDQMPLRVTSAPVQVWTPVEEEEAS